MKAFILLLIFLWIGSQPFYGKDGDTSSTTTTTNTEKSDKEKIPLISKYMEDTLTFSLSFPTAHAYLYDRVVSVDLSELPGTFTVRIISLSTGKEVASQTFCEFVEIDLSACSGGDYQLDIMSEDEWLQGEFTL
ncbi:DUF3244 domain-containing protein [Bacteroides sp.]|uniref:DUF3244 domain-containing protein n=1 Tax=Bacteroides sp. TaxID=29523 RepID=UPI0025846739|nr:DUF3244 domain-containing protein [Bacteroides sp.]